MAEKKKRKKTGLALAFWLLVVLMILIIFLVKKDDIFSNIKKTDFMNQVFGKTPEFVQNYPDSKPEKEEEPLVEEIIIEVAPKAKKPAPEQKTEIVQTETVKAEIADEKPASAKPIVEEKKEVKEEKPVEAVKAKTNLTLCFVTIDANGSVNRKLVTRSVPKTDSPLTEAIRQVLAGPDTMSSAEKDCMTLIPENSRLLSASVKDGIAYLNFNESFQFNSVGVEGYMGQLMQIVYTATSFNTVKSVQFMIEGEKREYLGSEGQWIGSPLGRGSF